jgi:hypothetical protein
MKILDLLNVRTQKKKKLMPIELIHFLVRRQYDGARHSRRIPSEESTYMAFFARTELNRNFERKVIGLS